MNAEKTDAKPTDVNKVFLWTAPRCMSTAFERAIMNLKRGKIFHEPFSPVFYFGPQRASSRYSNKPIDPQATYEVVSEELSHEYDEVDFVFSKDMAYYMEGNYEVLRQKGLRDYKHSFLIRNPRKAIVSLYRASTNKKKTGWDHFDPNEAGFHQMLDLYHFVVKELNSTPIIIDAEDVLEYPEEMMEQYCKATGLSYQENMTTWEPREVPEWQVWDGWHDAVLRSSGFVKRKNSKAKELAKSSSFDCEKEDVLETMNESLRCYKILHEKKLCPSNKS